MIDCLLEHAARRALKQRARSLAPSIGDVTVPAPVRVR